MNHSKEVYTANHTTLDLSHQKFAVRYTPSRSKGYIYGKLPLTSVSGSIFPIYTSLYPPFCQLDLVTSMRGAYN